MKKYQHLCLLTIVTFLAACSTPEEKAVEFYESGQKLLDSGDVGKARLEFQNALQLNQNLVPAWYGMAEIAGINQNYEQMFSILNNIIEMDSNHLQAHIRRGQLLLAGGQLDQALEESNRTMELAPENAEVLTLRAAVFFKLEDMFSAIDFALRALEIDPENIDSYAVLASERQAAGDTEKAIEYLDQGLAIEPGNRDLSVLKIRALTQVQDYDGVEEIYLSLIRTNPDENVYKHQLAGFYLQNDRLDQAEKIFRDIVQANPEDVEAKLNVIRMVNTARGTDAAVEQMQTFVSAEPDNMELRFMQFQLYMSENQIEPAEQTLQMIISDTASAEDRLRAKGQLAVLSLGNGDVDEANVLVAEILAEEPRNAQALLIKAEQEIQAGNHDTAISDLRTILRDSSESAQALAMLGRAHELKGAVELADDVYERAFRASQRSPEYGYIYGEFLVRQGRIQRAATILEEGLVTSPNHLQSLSLLAQIRISQDEWESAQSIANHISDIENSGVLAQQLLGNMYARQSNFDQSIVAFEQAYESAPTAVSPMVSLVRAYVADDKTDEAMQFIDSVLAENQDNSNAHILKGQLFLFLNQIEDAESEFREAIRSQQNNRDAYRNLVTVNLRLGRQDQALEVIDEGLEALPDDFDLSMIKASIYESRGDIDGSIEILEEQIRMQPNADVVANNLASLLTDFREDEASHKRALELALRFRSSRNTYYKDTLGWAYLRTGDAESALDFLEEAAEANPEVPIFRYHLGMAHKALGDTASARTELDSALELTGDAASSFRDEVEKAIMEL